MKSDAGRRKKPPRHLSLARPIIPSTGRKIDLTNEQLYELIDREGYERATEDDNVDWEREAVWPESRD